MQHPLSIACLSVLLFVGRQAHAQRTIVVDQRGASGSHYTELAKAISASQHGDIILVRPGAYSWPTTTISKGITIQGTKQGSHGPYVSGFLRIDITSWVMSTRSLAITTTPGTLLKIRS